MSDKNIFDPQQLLQTKAAYIQAQTNACVLDCDPTLYETPIWPRRLELEFSGDELPGRGRTFGYYTGYRAWRVEHKELCSLFITDSWPKNETCIALRKAGPVSADLGIHIQAHRNDAEKFLGVLSLNMFWSCIVVGRVAFWGHVVEHEKGWRAQYAYPLCLVAVDDFAPFGLVQAILDAYQIHYDPEA